MMSLWILGPLKDIRLRQYVFIDILYQFYTQFFIYFILIHLLFIDTGNMPVIRTHETEMMLTPHLFV